MFSPQVMKYKKVHPSTPIYLSKIREFGKSTEVTTTAQEGTKNLFLYFLHTVTDRYGFEQTF